MKERGILFSAPMVRALLDGTKIQTRRAVKPQPADGLNWAGWCASSTCSADEGKATWARGVGPLMSNAHRVRCPYGQPGDRLWVRETFCAYGRWETRFSPKKSRDEWHFVDMTVERDRMYQFEADGPDVPLAGGYGATPGWYRRPAIFMPRAVSRVTLEVTDVRVERLQGISEADAIAEGCVVENVISAYDGATIQVPAEIPHSSGIGTQGWDTARDWYADLWEQINAPDSWAANPWVWVVEFRRLDGSTDAQGGR